MRRRGVASWAAAAAFGAGALAVAPAAGTAASADATCGFGDSGLHQISQRRHITCVGAKHVLLGLRGSHALVPTVCGKTAWIGHWKVTGLGREPAAIVNRFSRGSVSFVYKRRQKPQFSRCLPLG
jgi:hypothetical protein